MRQISYKNKNGWFPEWRISPSTCRRYRDDSQLPAHAQNQRLAVLRLQQQRQQQGRVWQVHRVLQREHLPAWVHLFIILFFLLLGSVGLYSYLLLWIHFPLPPYFPPLCSAGLSPVLLFLSSLFSFLVSPFWPNISHCHARIVILLHYSETSHIAPPCRNVCTSLCSFVCVCVPKSCSRTPAPDLWQKAAFSSSPLTQRL